MADALTTEESLRSILLEMDDLNDDPDITTTKIKGKIDRFVDLIIDLIAERSEEKAEERVDQHERDYEHGNV